MPVAKSAGTSHWMWATPPALAVSVPITSVLSTVKVTTAPALKPLATMLTE